MLYVWYPKKRRDWGTVHEENDVIKMREEVVSAKKQLKQGKHTCLLMRMEYPKDYEIVLQQIYYKTLVTNMLQDSSDMDPSKEFQPNE